MEWNSNFNCMRLHEIELVIPSHDPPSTPFGKIVEGRTEATREKRVHSALRSTTGSSSAPTGPPTSGQPPLRYQAPPGSATNSGIAQIYHATASIQNPGNSSLTACSIWTAWQLPLQQSACVWRVKRLEKNRALSEQIEYSKWLQAELDEAKKLAQAPLSMHW
eukprot:6197709-Pleurochrysis_carterae.AAC.2